VISAVFYPNGRRILSTSLSRTVRFWHLAFMSDQLVAPVHRDGVDGLEFSPHESEYLTFGGDHCTQAVTHPFLHSGWVHHVRFSADDRLLAATTQTRAVGAL